MPRGPRARLLIRLESAIRRRDARVALRWALRETGMTFHEIQRFENAVTDKIRSE